MSNQAHNQTFSQRGGSKGELLPPQKKHSYGEGGARKKCILMKHEKTTFYIQGHSFSIGAMQCEKKLQAIFQGQIFFFWGGEHFFVWGNLKFLFLGQILFLGGSFQFSEFCEWEILNFILGSNFLFKGIFKIHKGAFFLN